MGSFGRCQQLQCHDCQTWSLSHYFDEPCEAFSNSRLLSQACFLVTQTMKACQGARKFKWWCWRTDPAVVANFQFIVLTPAVFFRNRFPSEVSWMILDFLRISWIQVTRRTIYKMVLSQGPEPYPFQSILTQFVKQPLCNHCPMELILDFLVGEIVQLSASDPVLDFLAV